MVKWGDWILSKVRAEMFPKEGNAMRTLLLLMLLAVSSVSLAKAQEATGETARKVEQEILQLEEEKLEAFRSTATPKNYCAEWVKNHDASNIVHVMPDGSVRSKDQLMAELRTGNRKLYSLDYGPQEIRVYGNGEDGTTAVSTYVTKADIAMYGGKDSIRSDMAVDVWYKQSGKWWFIVHSVHPVAPKGAVKPLTEKTE
jgi:hypothetical protein